jgi:hypothetical protein
MVAFRFGALGRVFPEMFEADIWIYLKIFHFSAHWFLFDDKY